MSKNHKKKQLPDVDLFIHLTRSIMKAVNVTKAVHVMQAVKYSVGIDLSKEDFKACMGLINTGQQVSIKASSSFANTPAGFACFVSWVAKHARQDLPLSYVMEATGIYYEQLAYFLFSKGLSVSVVLPTKAKAYLESLGHKSKTDALDARGLAYMGAQQNLPLWQPVSEQIYQLRALSRLLESLQAQRTMLTNQIHALTHSMYGVKEALQSLAQLVKAINKQIESLQGQIQKLIGEDAFLSDKYEKISAIKGVGLLTFAAIVSETNGFALIENQSQLVSYAGYDVVENQSGQHAGKRKISKKGNSHMRRAMHMPALQVVRYKQGSFAAVYERVYQRTGVKMKAYVAVQRKLLCLIYALWKKDTAFEAEYHLKKISENQEPKPLFAVVFEKNQAPGQATKKVAPLSRATQDELPVNLSPEALFAVEQIY